MADGITSFIWARLFMSPKYMSAEAASWVGSRALGGGAEEVGSKRVADLPSNVSLSIQVVLVADRLQDPAVPYAGEEWGVLNG